MTSDSERSRKQIFEIFIQELKGQRINECDGPNDSEIVFYVVEGSVVIVQIWDAGGWDYYLPGKEGKLDYVAQSIREYLGS